MMDIVEKLKRIAKGVFIIVEEPVANDISKDILLAIVEIERLRAMLEATPAQESEPVAWDKIEENVFEAMDKAFKLGALHMDGMPIDDTQIGVEFALEKLKPLYTHPPADKAWISVKDRLPPLNGDEVLAYRDDDDWFVISLFMDIGFAYFSEQEEQYVTAHAITHWMPLPAPPNEAMKG